MKTRLLFLAFIFTICLNAQSNSTDFDWSFNTGGGFNTTKKLKYNNQGDLLCLVIVGRQTTFGATSMFSAGSGSYPGTVTFIGKRTQSGVKSVILKIPGNNATYARMDDFCRCQQ